MRPGSRERIERPHRLVSGRDYARVRGAGVAFRGVHCLAVVLEVGDEPTRIGFIASKKGVGGAVQRNRARRRLREIVRRRWGRMRETGLLVMVVAHRTCLAAPHPELAADVERVLSAAGALTPERI
jgi:ribonuclease P protein component